MAIKGLKTKSVFLLLIIVGIFLFMINFGSSFEAICSWSAGEIEDHCDGISTLGNPSNCDNSEVCKPYNNYEIVVCIPDWTYIEDFCDTTYDPNPIPDPCGNLVCDLRFGENCGNCVEDCRCDAGEDCQAGVCVVPGPVCGDTVTESPETCDPPTSVCAPGYEDPCTYCDSNCASVTLPATGYCGDGTTQALYETCDDGNNINGDGCENDCTSTPPGYCSPNGDTQACTACGYAGTQTCTNNEWGSCEVNNQCTPGAKRCSGTSAQTCSINVCGFYVWTTTETCVSPEICSSGSCVPGCSNECTSGQTRCSGSNAQNCVLQGDGCYDWVTYETCVSPEICSAGSCQSSCSDECTSGQTRCSGSNAQNCVLAGSGCYEWNTYETCVLPETCQSGTCQPPEPPAACELTAASWNKEAANSSTDVTLTVTGTNCGGAEIGIIVWESDIAPNSDDPVTTNPSNLTYGELGLWNAEWQEDTDGFQSNPPEYYFIAYTEGSQIQSSNELEVELNKTVYCQDIYTCEQYMNQGDCEGDVNLCNVVGNSIPEGVDCDEDGTNCKCTWRSDLGICAPSYGSGNIGTCYLNEVGESSSCDGENNVLIYAWEAEWIWNPSNFVTDDQTGNPDYVWNSTLQGWHYDPINLFSGLNKSIQCQDGNNQITCPAQIKLPFFNAWNLIIAIILIIVIYILINAASKKKLTKKKKVKRKKK